MIVITVGIVLAIVVPFVDFYIPGEGNCCVVISVLFFVFRFSSRSCSC